MRRKCLLSSVSVLMLASAGAETVVVSATRTPQPLQVTGVAMTVITADDIRLRQSILLSDLLGTTPGVTAVRNGGAGQNTNILIRGAEAGQTLVLIDGIRINDPSATTGFALMGDVLANGIDRVEVLRGAQSTLYGSDAIGGVVNILTARGGDTALKLTAEGGSFDTLRLNAAAAGTTGDLEFGAAANYYLTNSISAADAQNGNREADGYHHTGVTGNVRWNASRSVSVDARVYYTYARDSYDGYPPPNYTFQDTHQYGDNELLAFYGGINAAAWNGRFTNRLAIIHSDSDRATYDTGQDFYAKGGATRIEYQGGLKFDDRNELTFGAEDQRTSLDTQSLYDAAPIKGADRIDGVYAQLQSGVVDNLTLTGGVRYDNDREFGSHTSFKLAAAYQLGENTTLRANIGDGFKAPSLYQLYSPYSNPVDTLRAETATGWEAGIDQRLGRWHASLSYFERRTANQIDFFSCWGVTSTACTLRAFEGGYYYNVNRSRAQGVEIAADGEIAEGITLSANYTNLTDTDRMSGLQLARRPHDAANAMLSWQVLPEWNLAVSVDYTGARFDDAGHFTRLGETKHANLFAAYAVGGRMELFGRIENLFDSRREPVAGYGAPGRTLFGGIRTKI